MGKEKGVLHIKLFEFLLKKNKSFGYVQIKDFLLANFEDEENFKDRLRMKHFLDFLESENYIEKKPFEQYGIWLITDAGHKITRNEISSIVRIKPKAVDIYKSYKKTRFDKNVSRISVFFGAVAFVLSIYTLKKPSTEQYDTLNKKVDSIIKVMPQKPKLEKSAHLEN
ncbi:hypothetical protein SAMN04487911_1412 [Arenibacter nanhaiticus]|uniref:Uncharacterized protein n=1 Tax=Arenibacter nanhaiticus TaxID=558155 RepID=A0A1M6MFB6_9FLAO|nr:hypothetical protein [Arenibacter nanhaiticus]SHJ82118.1 hypothetical protein SAMN04487911_1412 [Arenibacter nanhaiticus]